LFCSASLPCQTNLWRVGVGTQFVNLQGVTYDYTPAVSGVPGLDLGDDAAWLRWPWLRVPPVPTQSVVRIETCELIVTTTMSLHGHSRGGVSLWATEEAWDISSRRCGHAGVSEVSPSNLSPANRNRAHCCPRNAVWLRRVDLILQPTDQSIAAGPLERKDVL
jgi:hypothetical protein